MKRFVLSALCAFAAIEVHAAGELLRPYDGPTGMGCVQYNAGARITWKHAGGDWVDANGLAQGSVPFTSASLTIGQTGTVTLDVTKIGPEIMLRFEGLISIHSRETGANAPVLIVTNADGSVHRMTAIADSAIAYTKKAADGTDKCLTVGASGTTTTLRQAGAVIAFNSPPPGYRKLELELTLSKVYASMTIHAFKMQRPIMPLADVTTGFAKQYSKDKGICNDPRVLYCEDWDRDGGAPPDDWSARTKGTIRRDQPTKWTNLSNGVAFPLNWTQVSYDPNAGVNGTGGLRIHYKADSLLGTATPTIDFVKAGMGEKNHLFYRYYIKYDPDFFDSLPCDGGKRPGFAADNTYGGNGGATVWGYNGWSMRGHYLMSCDHDNPIWPRVMFGTYAYHSQQAGIYGDGWSWTGHGEQGLQELGTWACVEGETFVNDPGVPNGIDRHWIDGRLVFERTNIYMRGKKPAQGYGNWAKPYNATKEAEWKAAGYPTLYDPFLKVTLYLVGGAARTLPNSDLGISAFWGTTHHGGKWPFGKEVDQYYDQTVVATERIGCMAN